MIPTPSRRPFALGLCLVLLMADGATADPVRARGQLLYVPVYSEVPFGDKGLTTNLSATLSIRNTDGGTPITIRRVEYYSSTGSLLHSYLRQPLVLKPMAAIDHIIKESDRSGGSSASFLVQWDSESPVSPPVVEAVMVSLSYNSGLAFNTQARVIEQKP